MASSPILSRVLRLAGWLAGGLFAIVFLLVAVVGGLLFGANTDAGREFMARNIASLSGGQVRIEGIAGHFPDDLRIGKIEMADADGIWLRIEELAFAWSPVRLLSGELSVQSLTAALIAVARLPAAGDTAATDTAATDGGSISLPVRVDLQRLRVDRIDLAKSVLGTEASFSADGQLQLPSLERAQGAFALRRLDRPGEYRLQARQDAAGLHVTLDLQEQGEGFLAGAAGMPQLGPVTLKATAEGPPDALAARLAFDAGKLHAEADGTLRFERQSGEMVLTVGDIGPFAALAGLDLQGSTRLTIHGAQNDGKTRVEISGPVTLTAGLAPLPALVGRDAQLRVAAELHGSDVTLQEFSFTGAGASATAKGRMGQESLDLAWGLQLPKLPLLVPSLGGALQADGRVTGKLTDLRASADITGTLAPPGVKGGKLAVHIDAQGLPDAPSAKITATGDLAGAPLDLALQAAREADGTLRAAIERVVWRSAQAHGDLTLPPGATVPLGRFELKFERLADLAPLLGLPVSGAVTATLDSTAQRALLNLEARDTGLNGTASVRRASLAVTVPEPAKPVADLKLTAEALRLTAIPDPIGLTAAAQVDIGERRATIASLNLGWQQENLRLLAPARIDFADKIAVDRLRLGLRQAVLELAGRVSPTLDLTASLSGVTPDLAALFVPGLDADGSLRADARLTGTPAQPNGTIRLNATGLRARSGAAQALPPAQFGATADLQNGQARIEAKLTAGSATLTVNGTAPMAGGTVDLRTQGRVNLALLEPLLSGAGRRIAGQATLNASLRGTLAEPRIEGQVKLINATIQDYTTGLHLTAINGTLHGDGSRLRIDRFTARAGPAQGRIEINGSIGVLEPGIPVDLTLTARNARPISSDVLTATLGADLTLRGEAASDMLLSGVVNIQQADIRIPERLPASLPVLNVIRPGAKPPPPAAPGPDIRLDLTLNAPRQIFLRGRGLDVELGGTVKVGGTLADPQPIGRFQILRGDFSLAGQTLTFDKGEIGFDGGSLTDPSLNFLASRVGTGVTANLALTGTASAPKITLSSSPPLPQDEVLAQLLLGQSAASLGPLELAQIASALASLTGASSGLDPLNAMRSELGLDRLSIGSTGGGSTLDAGRYVAPGVYVGARQSLSGSGTQSVVQIDITKGLKLEGTVGTGTASATGTEGSQGTGVGLIYQMDY